jgi:hypothetical protein
VISRDTETVVGHKRGASGEWEWELGGEGERLDCGGQRFFMGDQGRASTRWASRGWRV